MLKFNRFLSESAYNVGHSSSDDADIQKLISFLQGGNKDDLVLVSTGDLKKYKIKRSFEDDEKKIKDFVKDNELNIPFATQMFGDGSIGEGGKKVPTEVQEMMTACLVLLEYKGGSSLTQEEAVELIDKSKDIYEKVDGSDRRPDFLNFFQGNFNDLATAISASKYILDEVGTASKVYWTGKGWDREIAQFNPKLGRIKDYNSSDIVVKSSSGKFYGYSLKKKATSKSMDPTLINKPITGKESVLQDIVGADTILIENAKKIFFERVLKDKLKLQQKDIRNMKSAEYSKAINKIPVKVWGIELKKPTNIFFKKVFNVIKSHDQKFVEKFLELVFRTRLHDTLNAEEFQFTLLTGVGRYVRGELEIEDAQGQELSNIVTALQDLYNSNLEVKKTSGKIGAWEKGASAAKVFLTIYSDDSPILDIEVRYKGSYSANPQFQAVATADFKKIFK
jgi:hypothetical protein